MNAASSNERFVRFAGHTVRFTSADERIRTAIETHFEYCLGEDGPLTADYRITAVDETRFSVSINGSDLLSKASLGQTLHFLMQDSLARLNGASVSHLVFHAAALTHHEKGVILCGKSGSGKSTLAAWLTAGGMRYLTDEVIALPLNDEKISGFCRSIVLKQGSAFVWRRLAVAESQTILHLEDHSAWLPPTLLHPDAICPSVTPRLLLFPQYTPGASLLVHRLTPAETLFRLMQCLVNSRNFADGGMTSAARLARQTAAYTLEYSDLDSAAQWITRALSTE